jgi:hypothetical protein
MSNKTISINPNLFSLNGSKTKKNREKTPKIAPLISPNVLKNKLLKRIKEHKKRETENLDSNKKRIEDSETKLETDNLFEENKQTFSDDFTDSINYLQTLSKQKKIDDEKKNYENKKKIFKDELERKTVKNYNSLNSITNPYVNIELPEELKINTEKFTPNNYPITIKPYFNSVQATHPSVQATHPSVQATHPSVRDNVPYGILKGGLKPTYREWSKTQRNNIVTNPNAALIIDNSETIRVKNERENRLNNLREKLKNKQIEESLRNQEKIMSNIQQKNNEQISFNTDTTFTEQKPVIQQKTVNHEKIIGIKKITKKTTKRKYTLGKSKIKKSVAVLIKDKGTRKNILNAQRDLKKKSINDIKTYLRDHNLIKVGSTAPNDVIRKLYESAMLAGEITNINSETLLHNFSKEENDLSIKHTL